MHMSTKVQQPKQYVYRRIAGDFSHTQDSTEPNGEISTSLMV